MHPINPPRIDGAFLITADGYIRQTSWILGSSLLERIAERAQDLSLKYLEA